VKSVEQMKGMLTSDRVDEDAIMAKRLEALSVSSSAHFGIIFGVVFGSWGQYGGAVGSFFCADGDLARQRRLKRRLPQNKLTILDPSWEPKPTKNDQKSMPRCVQILHWFSDRFLIDFGPLIDPKINPKSINKFFQNQPTNKSYFSFIFDQISKTISCSSKMVDVQKSSQNLMFLYVF